MSENEQPYKGSPLQQIRRLTSERDLFEKSATNLQAHVESLSAQLSSKDQECEELKGRLERIKNHTEGLIEPWKSELSSLRAERDELKKALHGGMYSEQKKAIAELDNEIILLQAENERLKEKLNVWEEYVEVDIEMYQLRLKERDEARKRCEDLEAENGTMAESIGEFNELIEAYGKVWQAFPDDALSDQLGELYEKCNSLYDVYFEDEGHEFLSQ